MSSSTEKQPAAGGASGYPRYHVTADSSQGPVIGDYTVVQQHFNAAPIPRPLALHQLPPETGNFVGRAAEIATVLDTVSARRSETTIFTISGMAGVGKSALAIRLAHRLADLFPDVQLHVDFNSYDVSFRMAETNALDRFLRALGVPPEAIPTDRGEQSTLYRSLLAGRRVLLVLDNASAADQVRQLIPGGGSCAILVTSRDRLPELVVANGAQLIVLDPLRPAESVELVARIGGADRVETERSEAFGLAALCGDLPLALTIAAARLAVRPGLTIGGLRRRLSEEGGRLSELSVGNIEVRASFNFSYETLGAEAGRMFRLLGLCTGPDFSLSAVAALVDADPGHAEAVLEALVDVHFVELMSGAEQRYRMHDLIREFCRERLVDEESAQDRDDARARLLGWYLAMAASAEGLLIPTRGKPWQDEVGSPQASVRWSRESALEWFEAERVNILGAGKQAHQAGLDGISWRIADASWGFYQLRKYWKDWEESHRTGLESALRSGDRQGQAWMLTGLGGVQWEQEEFGKALENLNRAMELHRSLGDLAGESRTLINLGFTYFHKRDYTEAVICCEKALEIARTMNDRHREAWALYCLSRSHAGLGGYDEALKSCMAALSIWRETGNRMAEGFGLDHLGMLYRKLGEPEASYKHLSLAWTIRREVNDSYGEGMTLDNLAQTVELLAGPRSAVPYWERGLHILEQLGAPEAEQVRARLEASRHTLLSEDSSDSGKG